MVDQTPQMNTSIPPQFPFQTAPAQQLSTEPPAQQPPVRPQQTVNISKPTSKISIKTILIGCGILFMMVVGGLSLVFYYLMNNPTQLTTVGLDPNTTKILLQTFSVIFFGIRTFLGIAILIVNLYRIITVKNKRKIGYIIGAIMGFFLFLIAIVIGAQVITMIRNFSVENILDSDKLIMPWIQLKDELKYTRSATDLQLIAPATMSYALNTTYFDAQILPPLGQVNFTKIVLDCGNGQKLTINFTTSQFNGTCTYFKKGEYPLTLETSYTNLPTSESMQRSFSGGSIVFDSEITVNPTKTQLTYNDANTEMIAGKAPSKVMFDASEIFKDLGISDYKIIRDFDGDGTPDKQNNVTTTFIYNQAKLYNIYVRFPTLNNYIYTFPLRVEQSQVPVCEIAITKGEGKSYTIATNFFDKNVVITDYQFDILDRNRRDTSVDTIKNANGTFVYQFLGAGLYAIQNTFVTEDGKQGQCESDDIQIGVSDFQVDYDVYYKSTQSPQFQKVDNQGIVSLVSGGLIITEVPTIIKIQINKITPNIVSATKKVTIDGKPVISLDGNSFEFTIENAANHEAILTVEDKPTGAKNDIIIPITIKRADIIGKLIVTPDTVGTDPFTVKFDASTTVLNDTGDELVSFTRDFGDGSGNIKKDFSEAIIMHTYRYDIVNSNGTYHPILLIKTRKGREITVSPTNDIIVKRATEKLIITIPEYPAQVAKIGDKVGFSIEFNGMPSEIKRDFGDGNVQSCKTRQECGKVYHAYMKPGKYEINASIAYVDKPTVDGVISIQINP